MKNIRNFCIIAHIDHGKSTLADRLLQETNSISGREIKEQTLDDMDLERERGITIKSHAIQIYYKHEKTNYTLNLIDTPGHVDFSYEVSRSIASCEGALLIVDATQGVQAQTISNLFLAIENDLVIIPILNKMDMNSAMPEEVEDQIIDLIDCQKNEIIRASGKTGMGIKNILDAVIKKIPSPKGSDQNPLQALIFDSTYDPYRGVCAYFKIQNGCLKKGSKIKFIATNKSYPAEEIGTLNYKQTPKEIISAGDVGYIYSNIKTAKEVKVGDTITTLENPGIAIQGFEDVKPMVFAGIYPVETDEYEELRDAMEKLQLNDASLTFLPESSSALGFGFRCGFLGLLHMEIIQERLIREYNLNVITTVPNVSYHAYLTKNPNLKIIINNPENYPNPSQIERLEEPFIKATIITKSDFIGPIINLCIEKRGILKNQIYLSTDRVELIFEMPLAEIVFDFYDRLKSISKGYASFDYYSNGLQISDLVKIDLLLNGDKVDALSALVHRSNSFNLGKKICRKLKELIPRQQFEIAIQAAIGQKIIARETVRAIRKDVTAKCYGGDISRKRKLLEKQKAGKKRMKQIGNVDIPPSAFLAVLKLND